MSSGLPPGERQDKLSLTGNTTVEKLLIKEGPGEVIQFSELVTKINRKDKDQQRVLMITDKAVYNLIPGNYKMKRRIAIASILAVSYSTISEEFVIHVAGEYDYRYKSAYKNSVVSMLDRLYVQNTQAKRLPVKKLENTDLKSLALTKAMARLQTREDELRRKQELAAEFDESDREDEQQIKANAHGTKSQPTVAADDQDESKDVITQMLEVKSNKVRIDDFELLKVLGRGSFGKVMQVRHKVTREIFAMKILKKSAILARNQVEHTKSERRILESLQHPFLMTLRYAFQSKDKLYFVLDYFQGGELFFHLKNVRRFPEEVARLYIAEIALALGHLHKLGYVYRDLKPENILLDQTGHVCLTDFGLSKDVQPGDKADTFCGTPEYLAPEIVAGHGHDKAVDWWSLGILLYELTVGIPPFYDANPNDMYNKIQRGILRFPPFLSEQCKAIIVALLNRTPEKRLGSFNDVEDIKNHPYYENFDWNKLLAKQIEVPFKPKVMGNDDSSNFDPTFTSEPVVDSLAGPTSLANVRCWFLRVCFLPMSFFLFMTWVTPKVSLQTFYSVFLLLFIIHTTYRISGPNLMVSPMTLVRRIVCSKFVST